MRRFLRAIKAIAKFSLFIGILAILVLVGVFAYFAKDLPDPGKLKDPKVVQSTKIYDRTGETILYDIHGEVKRTVIPFNEIPDHIKQATVVIEDDNFYHHIGIDFLAILRAAWANLKDQGISQGGSTITQQFIKNAYLGGPRAPRVFSRKIKEAILTMEMERRYQKDEILSFYLNQVPYGSNAYGIESAAQTFFDKEAKNLSLAESALLAALPRAPSYYSPFGAHPEKLKSRQHRILDLMMKFGYISEEEAKNAKEKKLKFKQQTDLKAHHFVTMVKEYLEKEYGEKYGDINRAGLKVYTTLDWDLQKIAKEVVSKGAQRNKEKYNANNAALVSIDPKTGQLLSLIGSKNYEEEQFNVATSPFRHPGSSFKPFAYAKLFEKGFNSESILFDLPTSFGPSGDGEYEPKNYDLKFRGPITLRQSLAQSVNLTSVKALYLAGINDTINLAQDMGITTLKERDRYGLSLVLGGGEVKLLDETAAYSVFAADGLKKPLVTILKIEDSEGKILEKYQKDSFRVLEQQAARQINSILSDESARAPVFGNRSNLFLEGIPAAAKTGTTQNYSDGWTIGYTPSLVTGVWAGNNDYSKKMKQGAAGLYVAGPIWNEFMSLVYQEKTKKNDQNKDEANRKESNDESEELLSPFVLPEEKESFSEVENIIESNKPMINGNIAWEKTIDIDIISGKRATRQTPPDLIRERIYPQVHSILYYVDPKDPLGDFPKEPSSNFQFNLWEEPVLEWAVKQPCQKGICYNQSIPKTYDDIHIPENQPDVKIVSPDNYQKINSNKVINIKVEAEAPLNIEQIDFFFNGSLIGTKSEKPYQISFRPVDYLGQEDISEDKFYYIKTRAYDEVSNKDEDEIKIKIKD